MSHKSESEVFRGSAEAPQPPGSHDPHPSGSGTADNLPPASDVFRYDEIVEKDSLYGNVQALETAEQHQAFLENVSGQSEHPQSRRSSASSAATVKARKLAAEALFRRRQLEEDEILAARQLEQAKILAARRQAVAEFELRAELAAINAEGRSSRHSTARRTAEWVQMGQITPPPTTQVIDTHIAPAMSPYEMTGKDGLPSPTGYTVQTQVIPQDPVHFRAEPPLVTRHQPVNFRAESPPVTSHQPVYFRARSPSVASYQPVHFRAEPSYPPPREQPHSDQITQLTSAIHALASSQCRHGNHKQIELLLFHGNTSEWLPFKRTYDETKAYFSKTDNLSRLRHAVRGPARESVADLLFSAEEPEEIMHSLEVDFADPELIVLKEIAAVKSLPKLSADLNNIKPFASKIRNCVATIKCLKRSRYLHSPELYQNILLKFNPLTLTRWYDYGTTHDENLSSRIEMLSVFLTSEATKKSKLGIISDLLLGGQPTQPTTSAMNKVVRVRHDGVHVSVDRNNCVCVYCKDQHSVKVCKDFKSLSVEDRWRWVREARTCFRCLKGKPHRWNTCRAKPCGVNGCPRRHHSLLHGSNPPQFVSSNDTKPNEPDHHTSTNYEPTPQYKPKGQMPYRSSPPHFVRSNDTQSNEPYHHITSNNNESPYTSHYQPKSQQFECSNNLKVTNTFVSDSNVSDTVEHNRALLKVIPVMLRGAAGEYATYALLDDGSTATLIDAGVASRIGAEGSRTQQLQLDGVGGMTTTTTVRYVDFDIRGRNASEWYSIKNGRSIHSLGLCSQTIHKVDIAKFPHLSEVAEELVYSDATPTVLIGAGDWHLTICEETRRGTCSEPLASRTALGWVLQGAISSKTSPVHFVNHVVVQTDNNYLENLIKEQYSLDSLGICKAVPKQNADDERALDILQSTARRLEGGRFEIGLPWRDQSSRYVPDSYPQAMSRLKSLEKQMAKDVTFASAYKKFIDGVIEKGYAEECPLRTYYNNGTKTSGNQSLSSNVRWYLPHFGVYHPQKKKLRAVHDAAAATKGVSLNSMLLTGPDLLRSLLGILFRFREGPYALTADVREMFPQIKIREADRDAQRFLWRDGDTTATVKEYRMTSMIFGAASSPCTAIFVKNKNALEHEESHPDASRAIVEDHYMDDYIGSEFDVHVAAKLASDIVTVHKACCFEMRSWVSNDTRALSQVPKELWADANSNVDQTLPPNNDFSALGIMWNPFTDTLGFRACPQNVNQKLTKRIVLSHVMRVYDPLGLLTFITVKGRILIQQLWREGKGWDDELSPTHTSTWKEWLTEIDALSNLRIQRWYLNQSDPIEMQLHLFADASEQAYACVAYWRFTYADNNTVKLALIASKARVAPLKPISIPRLELQAALIASRLADTIVTNHRFKPTSITYWSDSMTVLRWLRSDARCFKAFVAHRVGEICETTDIARWRWLPTALNVADDATRLKPCSISESHRWFTGPSFLLRPMEEWPIESPSNAAVAPAPEELRPRELVGCSNASSVIQMPPAPNAERFSCWLRLIRSTARVLQAVRKFRSLISQSSNSNQASSPVNSITADDVIHSENIVLLRSQIDSFREDINCLKSSRPLPKTSRLSTFSVRIAEDSFIRLRSRIGRAPVISQNTKSPIVLDGRHPAVILLIKRYHEKSGHGNHELVLNELRQLYWILRCRNAIKAVARACVHCRLLKARTTIPPTGDLPAERLEHHRRPFSNVGLDYFGPVNVAIGRRSEKRYVALFTCMVTRAVHLEVVASLSADSAIMSLRRFIARRGCPSKIFSDNGTAFVAADRLLTELFSTQVIDYAVNNKISWVFIPPAAPFMGGCWERMVRCVKNALYATLKERNPREEVFLTLLMEAEAIVNSRPLTYIPVTDADAPEAITPFHFLIGTSSNHPWLADSLNDTDLVRRCDWRRTLRLADLFWARWVKEYLPTLIPRAPNYTNVKWKEGDVVLIADSCLPRGTWPLGKITKVFPGEDGIVRTVNVSTKAGLLRRPVRKLVPIVSAIDAI